MGAQLELGSNIQPELPPLFTLPILALKVAPPPALTLLTVKYSKHKFPDATNKLSLLPVPERNVGDEDVPLSSK